MTQQALKDQKFWIPEDTIKPGIEDKIAYSTQKGVLFKGDIQEILPFVRSESVDTVFADPPFNLSKVYGANVNDSKSDEEYISPGAGHGWMNASAWLDLEGQSSSITCPNGILL